MKLRFKITATAVIILLVISLSINIVSAVNQTAVPGSDQDPIVSKSYVDAAFKELSTQIQMLVEQNNNLKSQNTQLAADLANQQKTITTLQNEISSLKSGSAPVSSGTSSGNGTGGAQKPENQTPSNQTPSDQTPATTLGKGAVNTAVLNLRSKPNTTSSILGKLLKNDTVTVVSKSNGWYKIITSKGKTGYVMATYITMK